MAGGFQSYSTTPGSNTTINGINIAENCPASGINDAIRQIAADGAALFAATGTYFGTTTGSADAYVLTPTVALAAYTTGQIITFSPNFTNTTTTPTLNVSGLGARTINRHDGGAMLPGDIVSGTAVSVITGGSALRIVSPPASTYPGFRNALINGNMLLSQRGTSFSSPASGAYVMDRWQISYDGTGAFSVNRGDLGATGNTSRFYLNWNQSGSLSACTVRAFVQKIEYVNTFANAQATVSFTASCASGTVSVQPTLTQVFGTGGSPSANVQTFGSPITVTTTGTRYSQTFSVPSIAAKTIGSTGNTDYLQIAMQLPTTGTYNVSFWDLQLEYGPVASIFERPDPVMCTMQCLRYYQSYVGTYSTYNATAGANNFLTVTHSPPMRTTPTSNFSGASGGSNYASVTVAPNNYSGSVMTITNTAAGNVSFNYSGSLSAEL